MAFLLHVWLVLTAAESAPVMTRQPSVPAEGSVDLAGWGLPLPCVAANSFDTNVPIPRLGCPRHTQFREELGLRAQEEAPGRGAVAAQGHSEPRLLMGPRKVRRGACRLFRPFSP